MRQEVSNKIGPADSSVRSVLRGLGRVAIWTMLGLLLIRGILADQPASAPARDGASASVDPKSAAFAVRFARTYLADPSPQSLAPFLAEGARVGFGRAPRTGSADLVQAEVSESKELGDGRSVLTVACEFRDARVLYLAVPIVRSKAGGVAALGAPSIVAAPGVAGVDSGERPQPLAGPDAGAIRELVAKFLPEYVTAREGRSLSYLLSPGAVVAPLAGTVRLLAITGVRQLGSTEGPRRTVLAAARISDPAVGAVYPVVYRLDLSPRRPLVRQSARRGLGMSRRRIFLLALAVMALWLAPLALLLAPSALAAGNDVGRNLGTLLRQYAGQLYGGIVAVVGLVFLFNRRFTELAMYFLAAILVGWLVFSPDQVADAARAIGQKVLP